MSAMTPRMTPISTYLPTMVSFCALPIARPEARCVQYWQKLSTASSILEKSSTIPNTCREAMIPITSKTCRRGQAISHGTRHVHIEFPGMAGTAAQLRFEFTQDLLGTCADVRPGHSCGVSVDNIRMKSEKFVP